MGLTARRARLGLLALSSLAEHDTPRPRSTGARGQPIRRHTVGRNVGGAEPTGPGRAWTVVNRWSERIGERARPQGPRWDRDASVHGFGPHPRGRERADGLLSSPGRRCCTRHTPPAALAGQDSATGFRSRGLSGFGTGTRGRCQNRPMLGPSPCNKPLRVRKLRHRPHLVRGLARLERPART